jgi:GT2 family glycosyltransferase
VSTSTARPGPLVSVIVPSHNHGPFVEATIRSVLEQSYAPVELIVIDDASTDDSDARIGRMAGAHGFRYVRHEQNRGLNATLQHGLDLASGEYVGLLASDDLILPEKVARQVAYLEASGHDAVFASGYLQEADGRRLRFAHDVLAAMFADGSIVRHMQTCDTYGPLLQGALFRAEVLRALTPLRARFKSDDWAMTATLVAQGRVGFINEALFVYRQHATNTFRDAWRTLPMRVEVVCGVTPAPLRAEALANVLASHGDLLAASGEVRDARAFRRAAIALDPSRGRLRDRVEHRARRVLSPLVRRARQALARGEGQS